MQNDPASKQTRVEIHSKTDCPHCAKAKEQLADAGIPFAEIKHDDDDERSAFYDSLGLQDDARTVPQIMIVDQDGEVMRIGGAAELAISGIESLAARQGGRP